MEIKQDGHEDTESAMKTQGLYIGINATQEVMKGETPTVIKKGRRATKTSYNKKMTENQK